jgi:hypothetical protein
MKKVHFLGEFGYGFRQLLPFLENYKDSLEIITWKPICIIIDLLWANKFKTIDVLIYLKKVDGTDRACTFFENKEQVKIIEDLGYNNICTLDPEKDYFRDGEYLKFKTLSKKIMYGEQKKEKIYVSVFPRFRKRCPNKNNITQEHIEWLKLNYPGKEIVGHGLDGERVDLGIRYCNDVYEQINVFNNSEIFICPSSGLADLALLCGCNLMLTCRYPTIEKVNPHNCQIKYWENISKIVLK